MRRITEFRGYKSIIEYDPETGAFETVKQPESGEEPTLDEILMELERVIPFPDPVVQSQKARMSG